MQGTFLAGLAGFFSLMVIGPLAWRWADNNPWLSYRLAAIAIIGAIGFTSAYLMSGYPQDSSCTRYSYFAESC